jgi:hypothetical protein
MVTRTIEGAEKRQFAGHLRVERRAEGDEGPASRKLEGHAAVFDTLSNPLWGFREKIDPGAFAKTIKEDDIRALFNHNPAAVLGRNTAGTLKLSEDRDGLVFEIDVAETQVGNDLLESVTRGDITDMSFQFEARKEEWEHAQAEGELDIRTLVDVRLFDISPVTFPAYEGTDLTVAKRSMESWRESAEYVPTAETLHLRQRQAEAESRG